MVFENSDKENGMGSPNQPVSGPLPRSRLDDSEERLERKGRRLARAASDGVANGLVQVLAPLDAEHVVEIRNIVKNVTERERDARSRVLAIGVDEDGLWVETETEKHAQHIADAISRARSMELKSYYDSEGKQRVLTLRPKTA